MASLAAHVNVYNSALRLLERRGYALSASPPDDEDDAGTTVFGAERNGFSFVANNPIELLGLTTIYEAIAPKADAPYWWAYEAGGPDVRGRLLDEADALVRARRARLECARENDVAAWEAELRSAFEHGGDLVNAAQILGITRGDLRSILHDPRLADLRRTASLGRGHR